MKLLVLAVALLLALGCSGAPLSPELQSMAERGLTASLTQVNSAYAVGNLYRVMRGSVKRVIPIGGVTDLMMVFTVKETDCPKTSTSDPQTCAFKSGFFVAPRTCSSRVRMTATSAQVVTLRCGHDSDSNSNSNSASSEELLIGGRQFNIPVGGVGV